MRGLREPNRSRSVKSSRGGDRLAGGSLVRNTPTRNMPLRRWMMPEIPPYDATSVGPTWSPPAPSSSGEPTIGFHTAARARERDDALRAGGKLPARRRYAGPRRRRVRAAAPAGAEDVGLAPGSVRDGRARRGRLRASGSPSAPGRSGAPEARSSWSPPQPPSTAERTRIAKVMEVSIHRAGALGQAPILMKAQHLRPPGPSRPIRFHGLKFGAVEPRRYFSVAF